MYLSSPDFGFEKDKSKVPFLDTTQEHSCSSFPDSKLFPLEHKELLLFSCCVIKEEDVYNEENQKLTLHLYTFHSSIIISSFKFYFRLVKAFIFILLIYYRNKKLFFLSLHFKIFLLGIFSQKFIGIFIFFYRIFSALPFQRQLKGS